VTAPGENANDPNFGRKQRYVLSKCTTSGKERDGDDDTK
jgi:hypothetical protein